ncbi:MAG: transcriptional repressor LexA [Candidatus Latescibacterota bacterium]
MNLSEDKLNQVRKRISVDLTPRQGSVLEFIRQYHGAYGIPPSVREICGHLGLSGPAGIHRILHVLVDKGYLISTPGKKRAWRLTTGGQEKSIPVLGKIAAGPPIEAVELREEGLPFSPEIFGCADCFILRIQGDSMVDAHILDGDLVVIRPQNYADTGSIVAVMIDNVLIEATLKILRRRKGVTELHAANRVYPPLVFKGRFQGRVKIVGKFVGLVRGAGMR